jgi:hypothetical protein
VKNENLRRMMYLKRKVLSSVGNLPGRITSLSTEEHSVKIQSEILNIYSSGLVREVLDPRSNQVRGHYFQERKVVKIHNVVVEPKQGVIYSQDGELIRESTCWPPFQFYNSFPWNPGSNVSQLEVNNGVILSSSSYGHWLLEDLPSTIHILNMYPQAVLLVANNPPKYVVDFLGRIENEVVFLNSPALIRSVIMIEKCEDSGWPHPQDVRTLQNFKDKVVDSRTNSHVKKIYASRRKSKRSPINELEMERLFLSAGFEVHCLEDLNFYEEISLISNCSFLAGVHGSALMNSVWMPPKSKVYEIVNDSYWTEYGHRLPEIIGHDYFYSIYSGNKTAEVHIDSIRNKLESGF